MISAIETLTLRKVTYRIVPFIMVLYFIAFIDRVNMANQDEQVKFEF